MLKRALILAALLVGGATSANAVTVVNGGFEMGTNPNVGPGFLTLATGSTDITGWTVTGGSVDYIGGYWQAQGGSSRSVDLAGTSLGTIEQLLTGLTIGQTYEVSFWTSKNPDLPGNPLRTGTATAGGTTYMFSYSSPNSRANMNWMRDSYRFTATSTSTSLAFAADASAGCCFGPALDTVGIAAVPEPATWAMMIGGFGLVGGALRLARRREKLIFA